MSVQSSFERFRVAIDGVVTGNGSLQKKLATLMLHVLPCGRNVFPSDEVWEQFETLKRETKELPPAQPNWDTYITNKPQMSEEKAIELFKLALEIFSALAVAYSQEQPEWQRQGL